MSATRPLATYSIVAIDKQAGEMGVAVQSHAFSVGSRVPWGEAGVGVVATQAFAESSYGPLGLALMKGGKTPQEALKSLLASDEKPEVRQVAMLDSKGRLAVHTGQRCIPEAGHLIGKGFSVQANLMTSRRVWVAMASAFNKTKGSLANRLMVSLYAAENAGGDIRGKQSSAILIVKTKPGDGPWGIKVLDLRVDDHKEPLEELSRLIRMTEAYSHDNLGDKLVNAGRVKDALKEYRKAVMKAPKNEELLFWQAVTLLNHGDLVYAKKLFKRVFVVNSEWRQVLKNLPRAGRVNLDRQQLREILSV